MGACCVLSRLSRSSSTSRNTTGRRDRRNHGRNGVLPCRETSEVAAGALLKMLEGDVVGDGEPDSAGWRTEECRPREDVRH